jgi:hypothetical protein
MKRKSFLQVIFAFFIAAFFRVFGFSKQEVVWEKPPLKSAEGIDWGQQYIGVFPYVPYITYENWVAEIERRESAGAPDMRGLLQMRTRGLGVSSGPDDEEIKAIWKIWNSIT